MKDDDIVGVPPVECSADLGKPDVTSMGVIRDLVLREEPLVESADFDSVLSPQELRVWFRDGVGDADWCRLECTWYTSGAYRFHFVDEHDVNWRFDRHPTPHSPEQHFHSPPNAPSETAVRSCIQVTEPRLVARAVIKLWRRAYDTGDLGTLNTATDPP